MLITEAQAILERFLPHISFLLARAAEGFLNIGEIGGDHPRYSEIDVD